MTDQQQPQQPQQPQPFQQPQPQQFQQIPQPQQFQQPQPPQPPQPPQVQQPQPQPLEADASIIAQLQAQNAALMQQNDKLNAQIVRMVQNGAQFQQQPQPQPVQPRVQPQVQPQYQPQPEFPSIYEPYNPPSLSANVDYSLESLASEIGKAEQ